MHVLNQKKAVALGLTALALAVPSAPALTIDATNVDSVTRAQINAALSTDGVLDVRTDFTLPDRIRCPAGSEIAIAADVTLTLGSGREVSLAPGAYGAVKLRIAAGGVFAFADASAHLNVPLELHVTGTGKIFKPYDESTGVYDPGAIVAHRIVVDGVEYDEASRYFAGPSLSWFDNQGGNGVVFRPWVWTGAGDGVTWQDGANWDRGTPPDNSPNGIADVSPAVGRTISFGDVQRTIGCVVNYSPVESGRVTLKSGAPLVLFAYANLRAVALIGRGREIVFDAPTYQGGEYFVLAAGGGRFSFRGGALQSDDTSYVAADGQFVVNGPCDVGTSALGCLGWYAPAQTELLIEEGAQVVAGQLAFSFPKSYFLDMARMTQTGGDVTLSRGLYIGHQRTDTMRETRYRMDAGTLTTPLVACGYHDPTMGKSKMWAGGFEMNGGTLTTEKIGCGLYGAWITLHGGTVNLGSGGLELGDDDIIGSGENLPTVHWRLGGVTIASTSPWATSRRNTTATFDILFDGVGGDTVIDTTGGAVTLTDVALNIDGSGFVKRGDNALTLAAATTVKGRGSIRVASGGLVIADTASVGEAARCAITVEDEGTLSILGNVGPLTTLALPSADALRLASADHVVTVSALSVAGVGQRPGTYSVGVGKVTVAPQGEFAWINPQGGRWNDSSNWKDGHHGRLNLDIDFAFSALSDGTAIEVDDDLWFNSLSVGGGATGSTLTFASANPEAFPIVFGGSDRTVTVARDRTLVVKSGFRVNGTNGKAGAGRLVLDSYFRCYPDRNESADRNFRVRDGELVVNGEVQGLRCYPDSSDAKRCPRITFGESSRLGLRGQTEVRLSGTDATADAYGEVVSSGAIDMAADARETRFDLATCRGGELKLTVEGGTFAFPRHDDGRFVDMRINGNATTEAAHLFVYEQNGGTSFWPRVELGFGDAERNAFALNGGVMVLNGPFDVRGEGETSVRLNGGTLRFATDEAALPGIPVHVAGAAALEVPEGVAATPALALSGAGTAEKTGPGTLTLDAASCTVAELVVSDGRLGFSDAGGAFDGRLTLKRGGKVVLNGTRVAVKSLFIRGKQRAKGIYTSGATARHGEYFEGSGELEVLEGTEDGGVLFVR